jgi:hypothetical protein
MVVFLIGPVKADAIDGRVIQVQLPNEDITLYYVEARAVFTVKLETRSTTMEGQRFYIGDGQVAVELVAHATDGIFLQTVKYKQGDQFKKGSTIKIQPGNKKAADLLPGDVYVTLPGVTFELPKK